MEKNHIIANSLKMPRPETGYSSSQHVVCFVCVLFFPPNVTWQKWKDRHWPLDFI